MEEKIKVAVYKRRQNEASVLVKVVDTDVDALLLDRHPSQWKELVKNAVMAESPGKIEAMNILASPIDGAQVCVTLGIVKKEFTVGKPVTRGGRPIERPITRRTMTSVKRSQ